MLRFTSQSLWLRL